MKMVFPSPVRSLVLLTAIGMLAAGLPAADDQPAKDLRVCSVTHVERKSPKSYAAVTEAIERQLGRFDSAALAAALASKASPSEVEAKIHAMEGSSGLMLFAVRDHGKLLSLTGQTASARQYEIGNPLIALQMTRIDVRAGQYAPLRIYVYAGDDHLTHIDYDLPSSVFGRFHRAGIDKVAKGLDEKLDRLISSALKD